MVVIPIVCKDLRPMDGVSTRHRATATHQINFIHNLLMNKHLCYFRTMNSGDTSTG